MIGLMKLALKTIGIAIFSISMLISFGLTSNQAFAGGNCDDCQAGLDACSPTNQQCIDFWNQCLDDLMCRSAVGGDMIQMETTSDFWNQCLDDLMCRSAVGGGMIQMETTSVLAAGAQYTAAWMIPVIVSGIGIAVVIARKF